MSKMLFQNRQAQEALRAGGSLRWRLSASSAP